VLFGVGYHSWIIATETEDILISGEDPTMGYKALSSHIDHNGGGAAELGALSTLARSGLLAIRSVKFICDNYAAILAGRRGLTTSVFNRTESDVDLIATIKCLEKEWCHDIDISYKWAKGHADRLNRPLFRNERLNIKAYELADIIRMEVNGSTVAKYECAHWALEMVSLRINGSKITSNMKRKLQAQ
jgi:hypothetical protein